MGRDARDDAGRAPGSRPAHADVPAGLLVGIGLQNPGVDAVIERYADAWAKWRVPVIVNVCGESAADMADVARRLDGVAGVAGLELNLSCSNGGRAAFGLDDGAAGSLVAAVRRATDLPLLAKLTAAAPTVAPSPGRSRTPAPTRSARSTRCRASRSMPIDRRGPRSGYGGVSGRRSARSRSASCSRWPRRSTSRSSGSAA